MKNVTCRKLIIDRSKAPERLETFKDISLYGRFQFPSSGGVVARSLAGIRKELKKTQQHSLSNRSHPTAGSTGATITEIPFSAHTISQQNQNSANYSVNFTQHATAEQQPASTGFRSADASIQENLPKAGFALKTGGVKRTVFTLEQKEIMIEFYNRQANCGIRANPAECMSAMVDRGLEPLKEAQIKSRWSTYHQKRKREMERMAADVQNQQQQIIAATTSRSSSRNIPNASVPMNSTVPSVPVNSSPTPSVPVNSSPAPSVPVNSPAPSVAVNSSQAPSVPVYSSSAPSGPVNSSAAPSVAVNSSAAPSVPVNSSPPPSVPVNSSPAPPVPVQSTPISHSSCNLTMHSSLSNLPPVANIVGIDAGYGITEWFFPGHISQSTLNGRNGSNACVFIALNFGQIYKHCRQLHIPGQQLDCRWLAALEEAIQMGNEMYDELYDQQGVNVTPEEAIDAVGSICQVRGITKEYNVFGANPVVQLENVVRELIQEKQSFHIIVVNDMAMSIIVDAKGTIIFVDSHLHAAWEH